MDAQPLYFELATHQYSIGHCSNYRFGGHSHSTCIGDFTESICDWDVVVGQTLFGVQIPIEVAKLVKERPAKVRAEIAECTQKLSAVGVNSVQMYAGIIRTLWSLAGLHFVDDHLVTETPDLRID